MNSRENLLSCGYIYAAKVVFGTEKLYDNENIRDMTE